MGLCTDDSQNKASKWVAQGFCLTIKESMNKQECAKKNMESLKTKAAAGKIEGLKEFCPNINEIASDQAKFNSVMQQVVAALIIEESEWQGRPGPKFSVNGVKKNSAQGLMQLSLDSVKQKPYECGCKKIKSTEDVVDDKKNLECGTWIAMYWIDKDGTLGEGSGNKKSKGAARYFQPFREIDKQKRKRMQGKVSQYCTERGTKGNGLDEEAQSAPASGAAKSSQ